MSCRKLRHKPVFPPTVRMRYMTAHNSWSIKGFKRPWQWHIRASIRPMMVLDVQSKSRNNCTILVGTEEYVRVQKSPHKIGACHRWSNCSGVPNIGCMFLYCTVYSLQYSILLRFHVKFVAILLFNLCMCLLEICVNSGRSVKCERCK